MEQNSATSAARNAALRTARGEMIAYLDQDDEFDPDYLTHVVRHADKGDVLVFDCEVVEDIIEAEVPGTGQDTLTPALSQGERGTFNQAVSPPRYWQSGQFQDDLFLLNITAPSRYRSASGSVTLPKRSLPLKLSAAPPVSRQAKRFLTPLRLG